MHSKFKKLYISLLIILLIISCAPVLYVPTSVDSQKTRVSIDTLNMGRALYVNKCGSCHMLHIPEKTTIDEWKQVMPRMQKKAKCSDEQILLITKYLFARSKPN